MVGQINFSQGQFRDSVRSSFQDFASLGPIPDRVHRYLDKGEVDPSVTGANRFQLEKNMWSFLQSRGAKLGNDQSFQDGDYDELLFSAYDNALKIGDGGETDPLDSTHGGHGSQIHDWDFTVDTFDTIEAMGVLPNSIRAAGAIDYVYEIGERMRVFDITEQLVYNWASGQIDIANGPAAGKLYRYMKLLDERGQVDDRAMLYRRVLNKGSITPLSGVVVNDNFPTVWGKLMAEIADYIDKSERLETGLSEVSPVSTRPLYQSMLELQHNLTEHCTGMAFIQVHEMYAQLQQAMEILKDPDIIASFGGIRRRNMWTVITEISKQTFGNAPAVSPIVRLAVDGNAIFQLVADFDEGTFSPDQLTELITAGESYIINGSMVDGEPDLTDESSGATDDEFGGFENEFDDF